MRIWSLHPKYLDKQQLLSCWEDGLEAIKVLTETSKPGRYIPQLSRFNRQSQPLLAIIRYMRIIAIEARRRGYRLDFKKLPKLSDIPMPKIPVTSGQLDYEWMQLMRNIVRRSPRFVRRSESGRHHDPNPIFYVRPGGIEAWEKLS